MRKGILTMLFGLVFLTFSCKEDEKFAQQIAAPGNIVFVVPDAALPAVSNEPQVVQPSLDVTGARFDKTKSLTMTINLPSNLTNLTVNLVTTAGVRQTRATLSNISGGTTDWSYPMSTLGLNNAQATGTLVLEFIAFNSDNSVSVTRMFSVTAF